MLVHCPCLAIWNAGAANLDELRHLHRHMIQDRLLQGTGAKVLQDLEILPYSFMTNTFQ